MDVKRAAKAASDYFSKLFPTVNQFSLEEVELSEDGNCWLITLGFDTRSSTSNVVDVFGPPKTRYKVFKVDARTGEVLSMKIRSLG